MPKTEPLFQITVNQSGTWIDGLFLGVLCAAITIGVFNMVADMVLFVMRKIKERENAED